MFAPERKRAKDCIPYVEKLMKRAVSRRDAISRVAKHFRIKPNTLRVALCRKAKTSPHLSYKCAFSEEEEELLEAICVLQARQGEPLTPQDFLEIASKFAGRDENHFFPRQFLSEFLKRHDDVLFQDNGKITSPTRFSDSTLERTQEFISLLKKYMNGNTMNKRNTFVFDETVIGDSNSPPVVIGERRKSGGGNINVLRIREKTLGCYIPFSMPDGTTERRPDPSACCCSTRGKKTSNTSI